MKKIIFSTHLQIRLKIREIDLKLPEIIYNSSVDTYYDIETGYFLKINKIFHKDKQRNMVLIYQAKEEEIIFITIHPINDNQIINRIQTGRWKKV